MATDAESNCPSAGKYVSVCKKVGMSRQLQTTRTLAPSTAAVSLTPWFWTFSTYSGSY